MDPFSFEQDVAPLRGSYFSTSGASGRQRTAVEQRSLQQNYLRNTAPLQDRAMNIAAQSQRLAAGQQAMEMNRLQLREQRDQMRQQREFAARLPESMSTLMGIMGADAEPEEKNQALAEFLVTNYKMAANPMGADVIRSVAGSINAQQATRDYQRQEATRAQRETDQLAQSFVVSGEIDALRALDGGSGRFAHLFDPAEAVSQSLQTRADKSASAKRDEEKRAANIKQMESQAEDEDKARATQASLFQAIAKTLEPRDDGQGNIIPGVLSPVYRQFLQDELPKLDRSLSTAMVEDMPDHELSARSLNLITRASAPVVTW